MKRFLSFAAAVLIPSLTASATVFPIATNIAASVNGGTAQVSFGAFGSVATSLNDQRGGSQTDITASGSPSEVWAAVTFGSVKTFNRIIFEQCPGFVVKGYDIQVANVANPNPAVDSNWTTVPGASFTNQATNATDSIHLGGNFTSAGIRVLATDTSTTSGDFRTRELYAFSKYSNLAQSATISAPGWDAGTTPFADETTTNQTFTTSLSTSHDVTFTWGTAQNIGAVQINGGILAGEHLTDYQIQYWDGTSFVTAKTVTGNTNSSTYDLFSDQITTTQLRLHITSADPGEGDSARVAEVFIFAPVPEPASIGLLSFGGLALLKRRRAC